MQKKSLALVIVIVIGLIFAGSMSGCDIIKMGTHYTLSNVPEVVIDEQNVPLALPGPVFEIPMPDISGLLAERNGQTFIDYSNKHEGYVTVGFLKDTDNLLRVLKVGPCGREYIYKLPPGEIEVLPLANGNGRYIISVHEQVIGNTYLDVLSITIDVELINEFVPFLRPNQLVWYDKESPVTQKAIELSLENFNQIDIIDSIYSFVVDNITYDFKLAETIETDYSSDLNEVLKRGSGICLDIASLTTAMLRSQGIPAKLVFGYLYDQNHGNIYHAWVNVFLEEDGMLGGDLFFEGGTWVILDPTTDTILVVNESGVTVGEGKIYHDLYYY